MMRYLSLPQLPTLSSNSNDSNESLHKGNWQPWPLRAPFLIFFTILCLLFALAAELLLRSSEKNGGLIFGGISLGANFMFNYLPTIVAVLFGLLWGVSWHDYRRLEPFFQMSKKDGATAENSMLLDYPYQFPIFLPWVAFKKRHSAVFLSSLMGLLIVFFTTPVMSGIFEERKTTQYISTSIPRATLPPDLARTSFTTEFSYHAYRYAWYNGSLPPFTAPDYTVLPFLVDSVKGVRENETWVGESVLYEADLQCKEAEVQPFQWGFNITNGRDCSWVFVDKIDQSIKLELPPSNPMMDISFTHSLTMDYEVPWTSHFMGHARVGREVGERSLDDIYSLGSATANCTASPRFLGIWAGERVVGEEVYLPRNWTAVFCEPSYWSQDVIATVEVRGDERKLKNVERVGDRKPFNNFDTARFHDLAATGSTMPSQEDADSQGKLVNLGNTPIEYPDPYFQLTRRFGTVDLTNTTGLSGYATIRNRVKLLNSQSLSGFALSSQSNDTLSGLLEPERLAKSYSDAYKLIFSFAFASGLGDLTAMGSGTVRIDREFEVDTYAVNTLWCRLLQGGFVVLAALVICLLVCTWGRRTNLDGEPNSLLESMLAIAGSLTLWNWQELQNSEFHDPRQLRRTLTNGGHRYQLRLIEGQGPVIERVSSGGLNDSAPSMTGKTGDRGRKPFKAEVAWELSWIMGGVCFIFFCFMLVFLACIYSYSIRNNGLPTVAPTNSFAYKILFSYLPTILGMTVEPLWVMLASYVCMVGPYEILNLKQSHGQTRSSKALVLDYDKKPAHFQLLQSFRARNYVLLVLVIAIYLANFLAVSFGGLFSPTTRSFTVAQDMERFTAPVIVNNATTDRALKESKMQAEMYYLLTANLSQQVPLPPWVATEVYILPFDKGVAEGNASQWEGTSLGFGANVTCQLIPEAQLSRNVMWDVDFSTTFQEVKVDDPCWGGEMNPLGFAGAHDVTWFGWNPRINPSIDFFLKSPICPGTFFAGWGELPANPRTVDIEFPYVNQTEYVVLRCSSNLQVSEVSAVVDVDGYVLSYDTLASLPRQETRKFFAWSNTLDPSMDFDFTFQDIIALARTDDDRIYRSDSLTAKDLELVINAHPIEWLNYLMVQKFPDVRQRAENSTHLPDTAHVAVAFEDVYRTLFAINLQVYTDTYFDLGATRGFQGMSIISRERVELSKTMFIMASAVLVFFIIAVVYVYWARPGKSLSHLPTTLAAMHTLLYASNALVDSAKLRGESKKQRAAKLMELGNTYELGYFVGLDGREHYGVYKDVAKEGAGAQEALVGY